MKTTKKTQARHYAFKFLFQFLGTEPQQDQIEIIQNELDSILEEFDATYAEPDREHPDNLVDSEIKSFAKKLILGILKSRQNLEHIILQKLSKGSFADVHKVNQMAVLIGAY